MRIKLGQIVANPQPALGQTDREKLRPWFDGTAEATVFLDAVDESKLIRLTDFRAALKNVSSWVGPKLVRTRFVISARVSAWHDEIDDAWVMEELLANFSTPKAKAKKLNIVHLQPMNSPVN